MEAIGIIPARGGSVRIPRKNMRELGGKPLVQWTIEAALASRLNHIVVSTEDPEIAVLAAQMGAQVVPQPLESALSGTRSAPVAIAALDYLRAAYAIEPELVCLLHPTSPFRTGQHINDALDLYRARGSGSVLTFTADRENGAIWLRRAEDLRRDGSFHRGPIWPLELDGRAGLNIDTWDDLEEARRAA